MLLSVLLGSHPPELPVKTLVQAAGLFEVSEGTARVALSRLVGEGDALAHNGRYRLSPRLLARQRDQDRLLRPATRPWRGGWELAITGPGRHSGPELTRLGLAELRPGVWGRPDNLVRDWPGDLESQVLRFTGRPDRPSSELASELWDLDGWAASAEALISAMSRATAPAGRFVIAAAMVRRIRSDPLLPPSLLPRRWPGNRLREAYSRYRRELGELLAGVSATGTAEPDDNARHKAV